MTTESEEYARKMGEYFRNKEQGKGTPMPEYSDRLTPDPLKDSAPPLTRKEARKQALEKVASQKAKSQPVILEKQPEWLESTCNRIINRLNKRLSTEDISVIRREIKHRLQNGFDEEMVFQVMSHDLLILNAPSQSVQPTIKTIERLENVPELKKSRTKSESDKAWEDARSRGRSTIDAAKKMTFGIKTIEPRAATDFNFNTGLAGKGSISMENPRQFDIPNMRVSAGSIDERTDLKHVMERRISLVLRREFAIFVIKHKASEKTTNQLADEFLAEHVAPMTVQGDAMQLIGKAVQPPVIADVPMTPVAQVLTQPTKPSTNRNKDKRRNRFRKPRSMAELAEVRDAGEDVACYGRRRRNQGAFRADVEFNCYGRCIISQASSRRCEAAHLMPHARNGGASFKNGLLLRADLHKLFDLGEMAINPETLEVYFSAEALEDDADLHDLHCKQIRATRHPVNTEYLRARWEVYCE